MIHSEKKSLGMLLLLFIMFLFLPCDGAEGGFSGSFWKEITLSRVSGFLFPQESGEEEDSVTFDLSVLNCG